MCVRDVCVRVRGEAGILYYERLRVTQPQRGLPGGYGPLVQHPSGTLSPCPLALAPAAVRSLKPRPMQEDPHES